MLEDHANGRDLCIVGEKGCGKSALVVLAYLHCHDRLI